MLVFFFFFPSTPTNHKQPHKKSFNAMFYVWMQHRCQQVNLLRPCRNCSCSGQSHSHLKRVGRLQVSYKDVETCKGLYMMSTLISILLFQNIEEKGLFYTERDRCCTLRIYF